jgi:hypothetical protein
LVARRDFRRLVSTIRLEQRCSLDVAARILANRDFSFRPISDFNG